MVRFTALLLTGLLLQGCGGGMTKADWNALARASCSMSMHCNPSNLPSPSPPKAGLLNGLDYSYRDKGNTFCVYKDGSVKNIGVGICPLSL